MGNSEQAIPVPCRDGEEGSQLNQQQRPLDKNDGAGCRVWAVNSEDEYGNKLFTLLVRPFVSFT